MNNKSPENRNDIFRKYLINKWKETSNSCQYLVINANNSLAAGKFVKETLEQEISDKDFFVKTIETNSIKAGYFPFLDILKDRLENAKDIEKILEEADVYYFHRELLSSYFSNSEFFLNRFEELDYRDVHNEKQEMYNAIIHLYHTFFNNIPIIILINNAENMKESALTLFSKMLSEESNLNIFFILTVNKDYHMDHQNKSGHFILSMNDKNLTDIIDFDFDLLEDYSISQNNLDLKELVLAGLKFFSFFEFSEAKQCLTISYEEIKSLSILNLKISEDYNKNPLLRVNSEYTIALLKGLGDTYFFSNEYDMALSFYNELLNYVTMEKNRKEIALVLLRIAKAYICKQNPENSLKMIEQSIKIAYEIKDESIIFISTFFYLLLVSKLTGLGDTTLVDKINLCEKLGIKHKRYLVLINLYGVYSLFKNLSIESKLNYCNKGLKLASKYKNKNKLGSLYHIKGLIYSDLKNEKKAFFYFKKSENYKLKVGNISEILSIYNGTGYGYFYAGKYRNAIKYYAKLFPLIRNTKDYDEICSVLYNTGFLYFFAMEYEKSIKYIEILIELMRSLNLKYIPFNSLEKVYCLEALLCLKLNRKSKALFYFNEIEKKMELKYADEIMIYELLKSNLFKEEKEFAKSTECIEKIIKILDTEHYYMFYIPMIYNEYSDILFLENKLENAKLILKRGIDEAERINFFEHKILLQEKLQILEDKSILNSSLKIKLPDITVDIQYILDYAKQDQTFNLLHKKITEINFMNNFQKVLLEEDRTLEETMKDILELTKNYFFIDFVCFISREIHFISEENLISDIDTITDFIYQYTDNKIIQLNTSVLPGFNQKCSYALLIPLSNNKNRIGYLLFLSRNQHLSLSSDDLNIVDVISKQITISLVNRELKKNLNIRNIEIELKNSELLENIEKLKSAQNQLIQSEKMASLGHLVAGVAHEINTPVGISITASSYINNSVEKIKNLYHTNRMKKSDFDRFLDTMEESSQIIDKNLATAGELIQSFKQIAVDQSVEEKRSFNLKKYFEEMILSISPRFKHSKLRLEFESSEDIEIESYPGAFYQILNNLIGNSILHAFEKDSVGIMSIKIEQNMGKIVIKYEDNGKGMTDEVKEKIFEPFFTTKRNHGGTGLGMSVIYNLITQKLGGTIKVESHLGKGSRFVIELNTI